MASTLDRIVKDVGHLLKVVGAVTGAPEGPKQLLAALGWDLPPGVNDIGLASVDLQSVVQSLERLEQALDANAGNEVVAARAAELIVELDRAFTHLRAVIAGLSAADDYLTQTQIKSELLSRMTDLFAASRIGAASPFGFLFLQLFGVVTMRPFPADPTKFQLEHVRPVINWDAFPKLFTDPVGLLQARYGWGTPTFDGGSLVANLSALLEAIGEPARTRPLPRRVEEQLAGRFVPEADTAPVLQLIASLTRGDASSGLDAGMSFFPLRPSTPGAADGGVALNPFVHGYTNLQFPLAPQTTLEFESTAALDSGVVLQFRPGAVPSLKTRLLGAGGVVDSATGKAVVRVKYGTPGTPHQLLELPGGGVIEFDSMTFAGGIEVLEGKLAPSFGLKMTGGHAALRNDGADSFLVSVLPGDGLDLHFDLGMRWSAEHGFSFDGSASTELDLPVHLSIAGLEINHLYVAVRPTDSHIAFEVSVAAGIRIGPVAATLDRVGALASFAFRDGNLGPIDVALGFKPPTGVGLAIDASVVVGGGFLGFDPQKEEYSGMLELQIAETIAVKAIGLLTTRMPDGGKGYSLVVIIFVEGFAPIQLGFGFALTGIGGLLGINRTFNEDALRAGLKNHTLDSVMFPQDPIRNAPQIISNLNKVFPPASGHHLFGPMAQIAWGTPPLITANLGVVLEFGARLRLLILAQVVAILPKRENDLVRLQMDAIGVIDFDQGTAALDATLYDSRLLKKFVLTGDIAMRLKWEDSPHFALAVGGLHPAFNPPPAFPKLERIALNLSAGDNPRLRCEAYFALTSNTVQFGARAELYASASGFSVQGETGFDVLIQLDPFYFVADFYAQLQLKRGPTNLFKVRVEGALAGPRPLHIKAKATFEILWADVSFRFDKTLVEGEKPPPPEPVDVLPQLKEALNNPGNWISQLPDGQRPMVTLRATPGAATDVLLHPLGTLTVKQSVVPLNMDISRFGQAAPAGARRFTVTHVFLDGQDQTTHSVTDFFAPAQFFEMSDDEKLARPSFEPLAAGVSIGSDEFFFTDNTDDLLEVQAIEFETITVDKEKNEPRRSGPEDLYKLSPKLLDKQARFGAACICDLRRTGKAKYRTTRVAHTLAKDGWIIVATDDLSGQPVPDIEPGKPVTYSEAAQALHKLKQEDPTKAAGLKILRLSEVRAIQ